MPVDTIAVAKFAKCVSGIRSMYLCMVLCIYIYIHNVAWLLMAGALVINRPSESVSARAASRIRERMRCIVSLHSLNGIYCASKFVCTVWL